MIDQNDFRITLNLIRAAAHRKGRGSQCEGENLLQPQARISLNYRAKEYLASLPSFYELHASLLEFTIVLEISLLIRDVCLTR